LRSDIKTAFPTAVDLNRLPTAEEISRTSIPYLDAVEEEIFRMSVTSASTARVATTDTTVLGHFIPKGANVFLLNNGASFIAPAFDIPESQRSDSSRKAKVVKEWNDDDVHQFRPERWLVDEGNAEVFNPTAGAQMLFGAGPRSCYGRRLAYQQLRYLLLMTIWSFELQYAGDKLSSYDAIHTMTRHPNQCYIKLRVL
jgi:cytochrome P450